MADSDSPRIPPPVPPKRTLKDRCIEAAKTIREADVFILATGAGFSADSGLAVYKDIADVPAYHRRDLNYMDLCQPCHLKTEPALFYGFWGSCFNDYRKTVPHVGYNIIKGWKDRHFNRQTKGGQMFEEAWKEKHPDDPNVPSPFFIYTSNVDNHSVTAGFSKHEVVQIHGHIELWQCSDRCVSDTWTPPRDFVFDIDKESMLAHPSPIPEGKDAHDHALNEGFSSNHPQCKFCGKLSRPAILMFGDWGWVSDGDEGIRWTYWNETARKISSQGAKVVVLEIGCGKNVPTVRWNSETMSKTFPNIKVIRINPDFHLADGIDASKFQGIQSTGLEALTLIEEAMQEEDLIQRMKEMETSSSKVDGDADGDGQK